IPRENHYSIYRNEGCGMLDMKGLLNIASAFLGCGLILSMAMLVLAGVVKFGVILWQMIF
ncbi:hypothetical protein, partial [Enterococcus hirae]|uniref:hypothetical protein n=1 Tax=Enterococcus hirae TaxID=1354 RepID=UPI003F250CE0